MSKEVVAILQNSLTENERIRKRQLAGFAFALFAMLSVLYWIGHLAVTAMVVAICYGVLGLARYIKSPNGLLAESADADPERVERIAGLPGARQAMIRRRERARCRLQRLGVFRRYARSRGRCDRHGR